MKLVPIEWVDSHSGRGCHNVKQIEQGGRTSLLFYCRSVEWLVSERNNFNVLVPHIGGEKNGDVFFQGCGYITIPTASIVKMKVLRQRWLFHALAWQGNPLNNRGIRSPSCLLDRNELPVSGIPPFEAGLWWFLWFFRHTLTPFLWTYYHLLRSSSLWLFP